MAERPHAKYYQILKSFAETGEERFLFDAESLGRELLEQETPPEEIGEIHEEAVALLAQEYPDITLGEAAGLISAPLMELLLSYGLAFRERAERRKIIEEERQRLYTAVEQADEVMFITDRTGTIVYVNDAFTRVTGYLRHEAVGRTPAILKSGRHDEAFYSDFRRTLKRGDVWTGEFVNRRKDGTIYYEKATVSPVRDSSGEIVNFVAVKRDITKERELEEELRNAHKMEAVGRLAGGVAHEFNNLLTGIIANTGLLQMETGDSEPSAEYIEEILRTAARAADITGRLLTFSRKSIVRPRLLDLGAMLDTVGRLLRHVLDDGITLIVACEEGLHPVRVDPRQIEQAVFNMVVNSRDAMPEGGEVRVSASNVTLSDEYRSTHPDVLPGDYVLLSVADTGQGMDEATMSHLFEPFFTTKRERSSGLGLAITYGVVKQSGGHIECFSTPGQGTRFDVYLPASEGEIPGIAMPAPREVRKDGSETILFVEDEESVLASTSLLLAKRGYRVVSAASAEEALERYEKAGPVDLLFTDVVLPGMNGRELAEKLRAMQPGLRVLYSSGYTDNIIDQDGVDSSGCRFLGKPYSIEELFDTVRSMLDA